MNNEILIAIVAVMTVLVLIIAKLASLGQHFAEDPYTIGQDENHVAIKRLYARSELPLHRIPITFAIGKKDVRRQNKDVHQSEHKEKPKSGVAMLLLPFVLSIGICLVCVCGTTWAWFSSTVQTPVQQTTAAFYKVSVESVTDGATTIDPTTDGYLLQSGTAYTVVLRAIGSVKNCGGYCLIENADKSLKYYTQTFDPDESITITFTPTTSDAYTFTGVWGSIPFGVDWEDIIKA